MIQLINKTFSSFLFVLNSKVNIELKVYVIELKYI